MSTKTVYNMNYIIDLLNHIGRQTPVSICLKSKSDIEIFSSMSVTYKKNNIEISIDSRGIDLRYDKYTCYILSTPGLQELFSFNIDILDKINDMYIVKTPDKISIYLDRRFIRFKSFTDSQNPSIYIPHIHKRFEILDISPTGLSFLCDENRFYVGDIIPELIVSIANILKLSAEAKIKRCKFLNPNKYVYGVYFTNISPEDRENIFLYIIDHCYKTLEYISDANLCSSFVNICSNNINNSLLNELCTNKKEIKCKNSINHQIFLAMMNKQEDVSDIEIATRVYSNTFVISPNRDNMNFVNKVDTLIGLADAMLNSVHFKYCISYIPLNSEFSQAILNLNGFINDKNNIVVKEYHSLTCKIKDTCANTVHTELICRELNKKTEFIEYCNSHLTTLEINCHDYSSNKINLSDVKKTFKSCGIQVGRKVWSIQNKNNINIAYVVGEVCPISEGSICKIYAIKNDIDNIELINALLPHAIQFFKSYKKEQFCILADSEKIDIASMLLSGVSEIKYDGVLLYANMNYKGVVALKTLMLGTPTNHIKYYNLTYPQRSIWNIEKIYPGTSFANIAATIRIKESVDFNLLEQSINLIVKLNSGIRTRIIEKESNTLQYASEYKYKKIDFCDFSGQNIEELYNWDKQKNAEVFSLINSDLFYFCMLKISNSEGGFYIRIHHVICDAWTIFSLIISKILEYYAILKRSKPAPTVSSPAYFEYIMEENNYLHSNEFNESKKFWQDKFHTIPELMLIRPDLTIKTPEDLVSSRETFIISTDISLKIKELCKKESIPMFSFFLSIITIYISRITSKQDIVIGVPVRNRSINEKETMGIFVNTIPVRIRIDTSLGFIDCAKEIAKQATEFLKHKKYPYELIQKDFRKTHKVLHNMFDVSLSYQSAPVYRESVLSDINVRWHTRQHQAEPLIIHISDRDNEGSYIINLDYLTAAFSSFEIEQMQIHILSILRELIISPFHIVSTLRILSETEFHNVLFGFNNTALEYPQNDTIHDLFMKQAIKNPNSIAVECNEISLTYSELNRKSNMLARTLRSLGAIPNSIIGILIDRSIDMMVAILGVLKSGSAYLPIDTEYPKDRIKYVLENSKSRMLITQARYLTNFEFQCIIIDIHSSDTFDPDDSNIQNINSSSDLAYLTYTSGSTGAPKGIEVEHKSVVNLLTGVSNVVETSDKDSILALATISFDIFVFESLFPLSKGMKIVVATEKEQNNPYVLSKLITKSGITILQMTPSRMSLFLKDQQAYECLKNIKHLMLTGEALSQDLYNRLRSFCPAKIYNGYGPTETTVWATIKILSKDDIVNIGEPIPNVRIYILDNNLNPVPVGINGEICIAGDGLSRGYFNNPELTTDKFTFSPTLPNERLYRTGDLAKWLPSGEIEVIGRIDNQVKIRGFRIELGEIEFCLNNHPFISESVVLLDNNAEGHKYLSAYIVYTQNINQIKLKKYLSDKLPYYMIPSQFIKIDSIPLTSNGKIDRQALAKKYSINKVIIRNYVTSQNDMQKSLCSIWEKALNIGTIGITDDYFELGGDSLKAIDIMYSIRKHLDFEITFRDIWDNPTIQQLSNYLSTLEQVQRSHICAAKTKDFYTASFAQRRIYLLSQLSSPATSYNMPTLFLIEGNIDIERLENAYKLIIQRHEVLRTLFKINSQGIVQKVLEDVDCNIIYLDKYREEEVYKFIKPFNMLNPPLMRVYLAKLEINKHIMLLDMHHIISDELSIDIILNELKNIYEIGQLSSLEVQYKDFSEWQNAQINNNRLHQEKDFWLQVFTPLPQALNLSSDFSRPTKKSFEGARFKFVVNEYITKKIEQLCLKTETTLFMILLAAYKVLLHRYTNQEDIVVGTPSTERHRLELQSLIGMFVNTLALRSYPKGEKSFENFLNEIKEICISAFENWDYPFDCLVDQLGIQTDLSRNPLFDTMFILKSSSTDTICIENLNLTRKDIVFNISKFDITLIAAKKDKNILLEFEYSTELFLQDTIQQLATNFISLLTDIVNNPNKNLEQLELLDFKYKNKLLNQFNNTYMKYPKDTTVHQLIEEQTMRTPDNIAVQCCEYSLTYKELNNKSNQLARMLRDNGVLTNSIVGMLLDRTLDIIISMLGILKSGAAYLPMDPVYPKERIEYILQESNTLILLTQSKFINEFDFKIKIINMDICSTYNSDESNIENINASSDLAYVIYTSGSTGDPKGVMIEHRAVVNFIYGITSVIQPSINETILSTTTMSFDIFVLETLMPLTIGAKVILATQSQLDNPQTLRDFISDSNVTMLQLTPSKAEFLLEYTNCSEFLTSINTIVLGGEPLSLKLYDKIKRVYSARIFNAYGPTETTVWSTIKDLSSIGIDSITIGTPIANTHIYIVDKNLNPVPIGVAGELLIAGDGLARGYLGNSELTSTKFIFSDLLPDKRLYKTGDLAKWLPTGEIQLLGRIDNQIKIRGFRVELEDIESHLNSYDSIHQSVVVLEEDEQGDKYLNAYIVSNQYMQDMQVKDLKKYLIGKLPYYMIPSRFTKINKIPLTSNGKINRQALVDIYPTFRAVKRNKEYMRPRNDIDNILLSEFQKILNNNTINIEDDFFEFGGNSIKCMRLISNIYKYKWNITVQDLYKHSTVKSITDNIVTNQVQPVFDYKSDIQLKPTKHTLIIKNDYMDLGNILITGATGFLGAHIVNELVHDSDSNIFCLVRERDNLSNKLTLEQTLEFYFGDSLVELIGKRIFVIKGDICLKDLGLQGKELLSSMENIQTVIHSAAITKHYDKYKYFHDTNIDGTKNVVDLCKKYNKRLHLISTASISGIKLDSNSEPVILTEDDLYIGQNLEYSAYVKSKFEAEKLVIMEISNGLTATIHRLGNLTERYIDGQFQMNINDNMFHNIIRSVIELGAVHSSMLSLEFNLTPVDFCSKAILTLAKSKYSENRVFHVLNPKIIKMCDLLRFLNKTCASIQTMDNIRMEEYVEYISNYSSFKQELLTFMLNHINMTGQNVEVSHKITVKCLEQLNFKWPDVTDAYLDKIINYWSKIGFIKILN